MNTNEMWDSVARSTGDSAGVFEYDGEAGHFYLYKTTGQAGQKITGAIHIVSGTPDFGQSDVSVRIGLGNESKEMALGPPSGTPRALEKNC